MRMSPAANTLEPASLPDELVSRYEALIERAVIISIGPVLSVALAELERAVFPRIRQAEAKASQPEQENLDAFLEETERTQILRALEASNGVISGPSGAAARLGIKRSTLQFRMQRRWAFSCRPRRVHQSLNPKEWRDKSER